MKIKTKTLSHAVTALSTQVSEIRVVPDAEGWDIRATSPDHASLVGIRIPAASIEGYTVTDPLGMALKDLDAPLKGAGEAMELDFSEAGVMKIRSGRMSYRRRLLGLEEQNVRIPDLELDCECMIPADELKAFVSSADPDCSTCLLKMTAEGLELTSLDGQEVDSTMTIPANECILCQGEGSAVYSLKKLQEISKGLPKGTDLDIALSTDYPMRVSFTVEGCEATFLLAPIIQSGD